MDRAADHRKRSNAIGPKPETPTPEQEELRLHGLRILADDSKGISKEPVARH